MQARASKEHPNFSLSDECQKIYEAKARSEDPLKTVYHVSDEDLGKLTMANKVANLQIQAVETEEQPRLRKAKQPLIGDKMGDDETREARRYSKGRKRKASESSVGGALRASRNATKASKSATTPAEETIAESSRRHVAWRREGENGFT